MEENKYVKEESVLKYYILINKLKNVIRAGWKKWNISRERVESVAEHIYSTQNLAIGMSLSFGRKINLERVVLMLAVHELEEIIIGDIPMVDISHDEKAKLGHEAVCRILAGLLNSDEIKSLVFEFDAKETEDAKFAYLCDKLDCDIQAKLYDEEGCFDLYSEENKANYEKYRVQEKIDKGAKTFSDVWLMGDEYIYAGDEDFKRVFDYIKNNKVLGLVDKEFYKL